MKRSDLEKRDELVGGGLEAGVSCAAVGGGAAVPTVLDGEGASSFGFNCLCGFYFTGGGANYDIRKEIAAFDGGLSVEKFYAL